MRCNLTLIPRAGVRDEAAVLGRLKMAATLGIQFLDINRLPLRINALPLRHAFVSPQSLYNIVTRHLIFQAILLLSHVAMLAMQGHAATQSRIQASKILQLGSFMPGHLSSSLMIC